MKYLIFLLFLNFSALSQDINLDQLTKTPKTEQELTKNANKSSNTCTYHQQQYPIWVSAKGARFIIIPSKKGGVYKKYLPKI